MKKFTLILIFVFSLVGLVSCSNDESDSQAKSTIVDYYGKWTSTDQITDVNSPYLWTEYYVFNADHTFTKSRTTKEGTTTSTGTFEIFIAQNRPNFKLTYSSASTIVLDISAPLFAGKSELLYLRNGVLVNSLEMVDYGPTYKKDK